MANNAHRSVLSITSPAKLNIISSDWSRNKDKITKKPLRRSNSLNIRNGAGCQITGKTISKSYARPALPIATPPILIKRNSSFFKESLNFGLGDGSNSRSVSTSPERQPKNTLASNPSLMTTNSITSTIQEAEESYTVNTDRFIPILQGTSQNKIDSEQLSDELPPPNASPTAHLRAQTKLVFKQNVAEACGLEMNQRILQYMPPPPTASFKNGQGYHLKKRTHYNYQQTPNLPNQPELMKLRKINTNPERILDAPGFEDDFYLNLLSWSSSNVLAIALDTSLYLWNSATGNVSMLVDYGDISVTSVMWSDDNCHISIGKDDGNTEIWDASTMRLVRTMRSGLGTRIGSQSWLGTLIATGCRSGEIQINDVRIKDHIVSTWKKHQGEICGLSYKSDGLQLASGGNDNTVMIWDTRTSMPQWIKRNHNAAVKALSWCPYIPNLLATGGGQTDKYIHFWNSTTGAKMGSINSGSQVSSLHWGQSYNSNGVMNREIVATGGNPDNAISVFNYDTKYKVAEINHAHEARICCSQLSPDGTVLATVGGDENLKFYKVFEPRQQEVSRTKGGVVTDALRLFGESDPISGMQSTMPNIKRESSSTARRPTSSSGARTSDYLIR